LPATTRVRIEPAGSLIDIDNRRSVGSVQSAVHRHAIRAAFRAGEPRGKLLTGTTAGSLIEAVGYVNFYLLTTLIAMPGVILFWYMIRSGLADVSVWVGR
jgi:hypothetical protein